MKTHIRLLCALVLTILAGNATAQRLRIQPLEGYVNEKVELIITAENVTGMTSLMFTLTLPDNIRLSGRAPILGESTNGHTIEVEMLENGKILFIIYSMNLNTFSDGELLRIPLAMNSIEGIGKALLADVRFSDTNAVSYPAQESEATITAIHGIAPDASSKAGQNTCNLAGQRLSKPQRGINITEGKKELRK